MNIIVSDTKALSVLENRSLRIIFGPKTEEMIGGFRKLLNEDLHNFYSSNFTRKFKSR